MAERATDARVSVDEAGALITSGRKGVRAMRWPVLLLLLPALNAWGEDAWIEVGADTEARYYVNAQTIEVDGDTVRVQKRAVYTHPLADNFTGRQVLFKESIGTVELDCRRGINRVVALDMIGVNGEVVWSSGRMPQRMWEDVREGTHGASTYEYVCTKLVNK